MFKMFGGRAVRRAGKFFALTSLLVLVSAGAALASDIAITSVGQSPDGMMVKVLMKKLKIEPDYEALMKNDMLGGHKVLIAVVGGSSKGLGAAGIDKDQEKARAVSLMEAAKSAGMKVLVMHVGGDGRRGDLSDEFIRAAVPLGDKIIVVKSGNADGIFGSLKASGAELVETESLQKSVDPLKETLAAWGAGN